MDGRPNPHSATIRSALALLLGAVGVTATLSLVTDKYPVDQWLAGTVLTILGWQALLNLAWVAVGSTVIRPFLPSGVSRLERLTIAVAVGATAFGLAMYLLGALGLWRPATAVGLVLVMIAVGWRALMRWWLELTTGPSPPVSPAVSRWLTTACTVFGVVGVGIAYLGILSPDVINYDARWWHLKIAEDYAREGRLIPFPGNWVNAYPHMASVFHTWDFLVPGLSEPVTKWMMVLHTEFSLFLWTLVGVAAAVRWLTEDLSVRGSWAAMFLFPGFLVYDANMGGASDHALAFFVLPLFLLSVRMPVWAAGRKSWRFALWGVVAGGALLTKLQAVYALGPLGVLLAWTTWRQGATARAAALDLVRCAAYAVAAFAVVTTPHFLKNVIFHGNPAYPLLQDWFPHSHPTMPDAPSLVREILMDFNWKAPAELGPKLKGAAQLMFTFAFTPHYSFTNDTPTFGFLFTASLPFLLVIPRGRRLWAGALAGLGAVFSWAAVVRVDRNLQTVLPLLVAPTAAVLIRAWRLGVLARAGVGALVALQVVWGADHMLSGNDRMGLGLALIHSGLDGAAKSRFAASSAEYVAISRKLPPDAVVLLHHSHLSLGFDRPVYLDIVGFEGTIDPRTFATARDFYLRLKALGVTHIVYLPSNQAADSRQGDVVFHSLIAPLENVREKVGPFEVYPMPKEAPPARGSLQVASFGVTGYADGLYDVTAMGTFHNMPAPMQRYAPPREPADAQNALTLIERADAVLVGQTQLTAGIAEVLARNFAAAPPYPGLTVHTRRPPSGAKP